MTPVHTGEGTAIHRCFRRKLAFAARHDRTGKAAFPTRLRTLGFGEITLPAGDRLLF